MISRSDIKFYRSGTVNDGNTNGGRMGTTLVVSGAAANLFPVTEESERAAGSQKYRKIFIKNANDADEILYSARVFLDRYTAGEDIITFFSATQTDTQAELDTTLTDMLEYGAGQLDANVIAGAASIAVSVEDWSNHPIFAAGMVIHLSDKSDIDDPTNEEFAVIDAISSVVGDVVTLALTDQLQNGYGASNTRVSSVYVPSTDDIETSHSNEVVTSVGSGDYDFDFLAGDNIGSIEQTWTLTFSGATSYAISGDTVGSVGTGNVSGGASPNNPSFSKPYFVLAAGGFSGVWQANDTIVFKTHPSAIPLWVSRDVPSGSATTANNKATLSIKGETA